MKRLGDMLTDAGLMTKTQLEELLPEYQASGLKLGQFLARRGIVTEAQITDIVSYQLQIKKYNPAKYPLDISLSELISHDLAKKYRAVPILRKPHLLTVAMDDPMDISAVDAIEISTNIEVEVIICTEQELDQLTNVLYGTQSDLDEVLDNMLLETETVSNQSEKMDLQVTSLKDTANEVPVIRLVNSILSQAAQEKASDIHISPEKSHIQVRFRIDGRLYDVPSPPKNMFQPIISRLKIQAGLDISVSMVPQDGRFTMKTVNKEVNVRVSTMPTIYGENMVLRLLDTSSEILSLTELGIIEDDRVKIETMINKPYGMILCSGPTGSGKSTTLYSMLNTVKKPDINIITVEDPVEFRMPGIRQAQLNKKAGMTFATGLKSILRQDPDVIMVGEIRDSETAKISVQAAMTGHRVLSTVHTNDAAGAITRFVEMGIEPFLVSSVMLVAIGQRLIRKVCNNCKTTYSPTPSTLKHWKLENVQGADFVVGKGCYQCKDTGYDGRVGIYEVLVIDEDIQPMILERKTAQEITTKAKENGNFLSLKDLAADKIKKGITTFDEAAFAVMV